MWRNEGRRGTTPPAPADDTTDAASAAVPAAVSAPVPVTVAEGAASMQRPAPTVETMLALINDVCGLHARAQVARAMAGNSATETEHATMSAHAERWEALVNDRYAALVDAVHAALPGAGQPERFIPVRPLNNGRVELHVHDTDTRRLVVLFTGAQAVAIGTHLVGYGAVAFDRTGQKLDAALPHVKAAPPLATDPAAYPSTGPAGPPPPRP